MRSRKSRQDVFTSIILYVCMYLMIGKGQIAQKDHIGAKIDLRAKVMGKYNRLVFF